MRAAPRLAIGLTAMLLISATQAGADEPAARTYTLEQAVADALATHPRVKAAELEESAAAARVDEARSSELPALGVSGQLNRSTGNTVPGGFFSQTGFVPIAGPARAVRDQPGRSQDRVDRSIRDHMNIIEALEARDTERAEDLVRNHALGLAEHVAKYADYLD